MTLNKPQDQEPAPPRFLELPRWAYAVIGLIALVIALVLHYLNAAKFPLVGTAAAIIAYLTTLWWLSAAVLRFSRASSAGFIRSEIGGGVLLVLIGLIAGGVAGFVWWLTVGPEVASLGQAIAGGAMLGGVAVLFLLGGP